MDMSSELEGAPKRGPFLIFVRFGVPGVILFLVIRGYTGLDAAVELLAAAVCTYLLNWAYRVSSEDTTRESEDAARDFLATHGYWPDEGPEPVPDPHTSN